MEAIWRVVADSVETNWVGIDLPQSLGWAKKSILSAAPSAGTNSCIPDMPIAFAQEKDATAEFQRETECFARLVIRTATTWANLICVLIGQKWPSGSGRTEK